MMKNKFLKGKRNIKRETREETKGNFSRKSFYSKEENSSS
jgi:hypothetical protein